eukprot:scaffold7227_cov399-Prasinococcus_capsulatus_cf.AAC.12
MPEIVAFRSFALTPEFACSKHASGLRLIDGGTPLTTSCPHPRVGLARLPSYPINGTYVDG